jgi:hypothetical protein
MLLSWRQGCWRYESSWLVRLFEEEEEEDDDDDEGKSR